MSNSNEQSGGKKSHNAGRIKPGEKRNPWGSAGKPKPKAAPGTSSMDNMVLEESSRPLGRRDGEEIDAMRRVFVGLLPLTIDPKLSPRDRLGATKLFLALCDAADRRRHAEMQENLQTVIDYKVGVGEEFDRCRLAGKAPPDILPHPDHVIIENGTFWIAGPMDRQTRVAWEHLKILIHEYAEGMADARARLREDPEDEDAAWQLKSCETLRRRAMRAVPKGWNWKEKIWTLDSDPPFRRAARVLMKEYDEMEDTPANHEIWRAKVEALRFEDFY